MSVDALSFDLGEFFAGVNYPEAPPVTVFMDPKVSYERKRLSEAAADAVSSGEDAEAERIAKELEDLSARAAKSKFVFHLKGVPREVKKAMYNHNVAKFSRKQGMFGLEPNAEADEALGADNWRAYIDSVELPNGETITPDEKFIATIREKAPEPAMKAIQDAITALDKDTAEGFEALVEDQSFLSMPSPEA